MSDLHRAARDNNIRLLDRILATPGINVDATDRHGRTPLHCAAQHGSDKTLEALLRAGASSNAKSFDGKTPLSLAMEHRHSAVSSYISLKRKDGLLICNLTQCPLHVHTRTPHTTRTQQIVQRLLQTQTQAAAANTTSSGNGSLPRPFTQGLSAPQKASPVVQVSQTQQSLDSDVRVAAHGLWGVTS